MKRQVKIALSCICFAADALSAGLAALAGIRPRARLVILYYHGVSAGQRADFARQMDTVLRTARVVAPDWKGDGQGGRACAVTFDDGFVSVLRNALPELAARGMVCTIFFPAGLLGEMPGWQMEAPPGEPERVAGAEAVRALPAGLVTVGAHSMTHPFLTRLSRPIARREVECARLVLAGICGRDVGLLAFPYGDYDAGLVELCRRAGYAHVFTSEPALIDAAAGGFVRGRVAVEPDDGPLEFRLKLAGAYRWMRLASRAKRRLRVGRLLPAAARPAPEGRWR